MRNDRIKQAKLTETLQKSNTNLKNPFSFIFSNRNGTAVVEARKEAIHGKEVGGAFDGPNKML